MDGYYDAMLALFDKAYEEGFLNLASRNIVVFAPTAHALLDGLKVMFQPDSIDLGYMQWIVQKLIHLCVKFSNFIH